MKTFVGGFFILTVALGCSEGNQIRSFGNDRAEQTKNESASNKVSKGPILVSEKWLLDNADASPNGLRLYMLDKSKPEDAVYIEKIERSGVHSENGQYLVGVKHQDLEGFLDFSYSLQPQVSDTSFDLVEPRNARLVSPVRPRIVVADRDRAWNIEYHREQRAKAGLPKLADLGPIDADEAARLNNIIKHKLKREQAGLPKIADLGPMDAVEEARLEKLYENKMVRTFGRKIAADLGPMDEALLFNLALHAYLRSIVLLPELEIPSPMDAVEEARLRNLQAESKNIADHQHLRWRANLPRLARSVPMDADEKARLQIRYHGELRREAGLPELADLGPMDAVEKARLKNIFLHRFHRREAGLPELADLGPMDAVEEARLKNLARHINWRREAGLPEIADLGPMGMLEAARLMFIGGPRWLFKGAVREYNYYFVAPAGPAPGLGVHSLGRDAKTQAIVRKFMSEHLDEESLDAAFSAFEIYLHSQKASMKREKWDKIQLALNGRKIESFQGLLQIEDLAATGRSGKRFLGALYKFADDLKDPKDKEAAKISILNALNDNIENNAPICPQGQSQHFVTAVLQGRLPYARVDDEVPVPLSDAQVSTSFFTTARQVMDGTQLRAEIEAFIRVSPLVDRAQLERIVEGHIANLGDGVSRPTELPR